MQQIITKQNFRIIFVLVLFAATALFGVKKFSSYLKKASNRTFHEELQQLGAG